MYLKLQFTAQARVTLFLVLQVSINKQPVYLQNCLSLLTHLLQGKDQKRFLTSIDCMSILMQCQQQYVAHEVQGEQAWSKI